MKSNTKEASKKSFPDLEDRTKELQYMSQYMSWLITKPKLTTLNQAS